MAKALKTAALVVGVAALAVVTAGAGIAVAAGASLSYGIGAATAIAGLSSIGLTVGTLAAVAGGLSAASALLTKPPGVTASQTERLTASIDPRAFRKTVLGQTAMATDIRYEEWSGNDQEYLDWIICLASHAIDGVEEIWQDQEMLWSATTGVVAKYTGYFSVPNIVLEGSAANAFTFASGRWNAASARLTGCAYLRLRFKTSGNGKKATSPFANGISTRLTIIGRGAKLYDPRRDSTVPGGSGPMRADDQSTWRYTTDDGVVIGENLALQILRVVLGWRIAGKLATGSGVPGRRNALVSYQVAANICDELVNRSAGGQEPRYHGAGVISEGDDPKTVLDMLCAACCGRFRDTGGKLALVIAHNDLAAAAADDGLTDDDVVGAFTWDPDPSLEATPNVIRGRYVDASSASLYQLIDYPEVRIASTDGQDRIATLDLGVVESASQAQRIARQVLQRKQYQRTFSAPFDIRAWKYGVGDVVPFTFAPLGFTRAIFRVAEQELGQGGTCAMTLSIEHQQIYAWDASDAAPVLAADPIAYDARNNPLILAIDEAGKTATDYVAPGAIIGGDRDPDTGVVTGGRPAAEVVAQLERIDVDTAAFAAGTNDALAALALADVDQQAAQRQAQRAAGTLSDTLLRLVSESARTRAVLRDAGVVVDAATGIVRIYAVDQAAERISRAEIGLDAANAKITTKASVDFVQEQIALAVLDPSQVAELEPLIARVTSAESEIDGLQAAVLLKASVVELTAVGGRVTIVEQDLDALAGTVSTKVEQSVFDQLAVRTGSVEQTLSSLGNVSGISVTIRQAQYAADDAGKAALRAVLAGDDAARRQLTAAAEVRQQLYAKIGDDLATEATARLALAVEVGAANARAVQETTARIGADKVLAQSIDALGVTNGEQAAAIATLQSAALTAAGGIAGVSTTIRQQVREADTEARALLGALIAGDTATRARATQLAQVQNEFSTTLVANEAASAVARQTLLARMGALEGAIVDSARVSAASDAVLAESLRQVTTVQGDHTASISLLLRSVDGQEAVAQLSVDVNGAVTGFRINGQDKVFAIQADRFIIGSQQIFSVDTTTGKTRMHDVEVDTFKNNSVIVPAYVATSAAIVGTGFGSGSSGGGGGGGGSGGGGRIGEQQAEQ